MKKTLFIVTLSLLIVAGYVVGQVKFNASDSEKTDQKDIALIEHQGVADESRNSSKSDRNAPNVGENSSPDSIISSDDTTAKCDALIPECGYYPQDPVVKPNPEIGNPKGSKIIKTGSVEIEIKKGEVTKKFDDVIALIPEGGYLEYSQTNLESSTVTVRVPADKLDQVLVALRKIGKITNESIDSQDRTYDSISYDASLKILEQKEAALTALLSKAKEVYEIENIQNQLFYTRQEIETTQGMKKVLDEQVALSTLTITIAEKGVIDDDEGKSILGKAWSTSSEAMLTTVAGIMIVLSYSFPVIVLVALVIFLVKTLKARRKASKSKSPEEK